MMQPKTSKEARSFRYGTWSGRPKGNPYREGKCAYQIYPPPGFIACQCSRKNGHGNEKMFCKQHAKIMARRNL